ncbi:hypothetical protein [Streptomyces sp. ISL-94]|uniref:SCO4983 family protein n=1 Tax=Streptomyces sp. ISL-94 TaxID=2819190 RepID=UPI001BEC1FC9|nr:hypothetical protein [Streptomyces sp. ISL-94]MBT2480424.1 hypothetical protein [Streptomyces sp. ISL-94]
MYEPIRPKSVVHRMGGSPTEHDYPQRSRGEALDIQLAGHLAALLAVTDELGLGGEEGAAAIAAQVARLRGAQPARVPSPQPDAAPVGNSAGAAALHQRAHDLAARALLVAASRADTTVAILAAERMDAHAAALASLDSRDLAGAH